MRHHVNEELGGLGSCGGGVWEEMKETVGWGYLGM